MLGSVFVEKNILSKKTKKQLRLWRDLVGIVREVWGSTRGTPMPRLWFLGFVERQAPRCYRVVVLGWTPLSQKPIPRPDAQNNTIHTSFFSQKNVTFIFILPDKLRVFFCAAFWFRVSCLYVYSNIFFYLFSIPFSKSTGDSFCCFGGGGERLIHILSWKRKEKIYPIAHAILKPFLDNHHFLTIYFWLASYHILSFEGSIGAKYLR